MPSRPSRSPLSAPLPDVPVCRSSCQYATPAISSRARSAPARTGPGSAADRPSRRMPALAVSAGATTASAHASATPTPTSHTTAFAPDSSRSPSRVSPPRSASSPVNGPASSGATTAAGTASSSASIAAREAIRPREPPRARSTSVSPARSVLSNRATSSSVYPASSTSCTATITMVERDTSRARSIWSMTVGSEVRTVAPPPSTGSASSAFTPSVADRRRSPVRSVVTVRKSAEASQDDRSVVTRGEPSTAGSVSSGP